jgi:hypothetical protein
MIVVHPNSLNTSAKPVKPHRLPNSNTDIVKVGWGGLCGEADTNKITVPLQVARAELQRCMSLMVACMRAAFLAPPAAKHPAERVVSAFSVVEAVWKLLC